MKIATARCSQTRLQGHFINAALTVSFNLKSRLASAALSHRAHGPGLPPGSTGEAQVTHTVRSDSRLGESDHGGNSESPRPRRAPVRSPLNFSVILEVHFVSRKLMVACSDVQG
eukprot:456434-Hanusia_phi.AAC.1